MSSPTILAIETATSSCSVALSVGDRIEQRAEIGNNVHSKVLLSMVQELFFEMGVTATDLHAVAVGQGPGSFTGLRIGVGVGQGIAYGVGCPMVGVSSLDALAAQTDQDGYVIAGIDARMGEIYWGEYRIQTGELQRLSNLQVTPPAKVRAKQAGVLVGNAWVEYWQALDTTLRDQTSRLESIVYPSAAALLELAQAKFDRGEVVAAREFAPVYIRDDVAKKASGKKK